MYFVTTAPFNVALEYSINAAHENNWKHQPLVYTDTSAENICTKRKKSTSLSGTTKISPEPNT
jgi:hypothetical protein